jgi:DUF4097 and DUF4098 domain-containing protein YvlB
MVDVGTEQVVDGAFSVGDGASLDVRNVAGRVTVRKADEPVVRVHAVKHGRPGDIERTRVELRQEGNAVYAETRKDEPGGSMCAVDYDIVVPFGCTLRLHTVSADVDAHGTGASGELETVSGAIAAVEMSGEVRITTVSGAVTARNLDGALTLHTTSGGAGVTASRLESFDIHTVSGMIRIETPLFPDGRYAVQSVSGDLHLAVPEGTGITVSVHSVSGGISSELPAGIRKVGFGDWRGEISGGGAALDMSTVSGSVRITRAA